MHFLGNQQWVIIAVVFFGIIGYIVWMRWRDRKWIDERFGSRPILAMSFGVNFFGKTSEPGKPRRSSGFLLLLSDQLFYRSRVKKIELEIPGARIARVYHDRSHKGVDLHQSLVKIDFVNDQNQKDTAAFKVPYPPQWMQAIDNALIKKKK
ncbi:MAG: hypothetical protein OET63_09875 [Desulfobacterales bacterium]|jgi:hypothetical protein|nr:hypothetical protein [Desulfobacterales bacterium]